MYNIYIKNKHFYKYINILHHKNNTLLIIEIQFKKIFVLPIRIALCFIPKYR